MTRARRLPVWLFVSAAWLAPAFLAAAREFVQAGGGAEGATHALFEGGDWLLLAFLTPGVFFLARRFPLERGSLSRRLPVHFAGALVLCAAWSGGGALLSVALVGTTPFGMGAFNWFLTTIPFGTAAYFSMVGVEHAFFYLTRASRLEAQLADARLSALRMQLQPHFLFNSLNAITVIVRDKDTQTATRLLEQLGEMLRRVMRSDRPQEVPLAEELDFVRQYLGIESVRFSDRLRPEFAVEPAALRAAVPEFVLQPLVENAIRHGLAQRTEATLLRIEARREGDELVLAVIDDGPGPARAGEGVGLGTTRERLATLYGDRARLELVALPEGGARVTVRLPYREMEAPAA